MTVLCSVKNLTQPGSQSGKSLHKLCVGDNANVDAPNPFTHDQAATDGVTSDYFIMQMFVGLQDVRNMIQQLETTAADLKYIHGGTGEYTESLVCRGISNLRCCCHLLH